MKKLDGKKRDDEKVRTGTYSKNSIFIIESLPNEDGAAATNPEHMYNGRNQTATSYENEVRRIV